MPAGTFKEWLKADRVGVEGTQHVQRPKGQKSLGLWRTELHLYGWRVAMAVKAKDLARSEDLDLHHKGRRSLWRVRSRTSG